MKKCFPLFLFLVFLVALLSNSAYADSAYPESEHPYESDMDHTWVYEHPDPADYLAITFSEETETESKWDHIYLFTSEDDQQVFEGDELSGKTVYVPGNSFSIRLTSDGSVNKYGFSITSITALTQQEYEELADWIIEDGVITGYSGTATDLVIPASVGGQVIRGIGENAFEENETIVSVTITDGLTSIGSNAFSFCENLTTVSIPATVTQIGFCAFSCCSSLNSVSIPSSLETLQSETFFACTSLTSIDIPEGVTAIEDHVFESCTGLISVHLPASVTRIGEYNFNYCTSLTSITVSDGNPVYASVNGMVINKAQTSLIIVSPGIETALIPDGVTVINEWVFEGCPNLTTVTMPDSVTLVAYSAFEGCENLRNITFSANLETIGNYAFYGCKSLTDVHLPVSVKVIGKGAFSFCAALTDIYYAGGKDSLEVHSHPSDESYANITIHFADGSSLSLEDCINILASGSCGSNLTWKLNRDGMLIISGSGAMDDYMKKTEYKYDASGRQYSYTYYTHPWRDLNDRIACVRVEEGVTTIGNMAFADISSLRSVCLPQSLSRVVYGAFNGAGLTDVYYAGSEEQWSTVYKEQYNAPLTSATFHWNDTDMPLPDIIFWSYSDGVLTVSGRGEMENYNLWSSTTTYGSGETVYTEYVDYPWKSVADEITTVRVREGVTAIGQNCFARMDALVNVELPQSLVTVKSHAFGESDALITIAIPSGVALIEDEVFDHCSSLKNIVVSQDNPSYRSTDGVLFTKNGEELLCYGAGRTQESYIVPDGVKIICAYAFSGCAYLQEVNLPEGLQAIRHYAFENAGLKYVKIPQGTHTINYGAFLGCENLTFTAIPLGITYLSDDIFSDCPLAYVDFEGTEDAWNALLTSGSYNEQLENATVFFGCGYVLAEEILRMPNDLTSIEEAAFEGGPFTHMYLGEHVESIGSKAFAGCVHLRYVYIPNANVSIASDAFDGDYFVVIACREGSSAYQYAVEHGIPYERSE